MAQEISAVEIFSSITYLPLEAKQGSLFGNIHQLEVTDDYIIILDKQVEMSSSTTYGAIFIFEKNREIPRENIKNTLHEKSSRISVEF